MVKDKMTSEHKMQAEFFQQCWNEFPETRNLLCYNLNNSKNKIDGARNKAMGLIPGRSDMVFYWKGKAHFLECKLPGGKQSATQKKWEELVKRNGFNYYIITSNEQGKVIIQNIIENN